MRRPHAVNGALAQKPPQRPLTHASLSLHRPIVFTSVSAPLDTCPIAHPPLPACGLAGNNLTNNGKDMSGLLKLVEILPLTKIESLGCAAAASSV